MNTDIESLERTALDEYREQINKIDREIIKELWNMHRWNFSTERYSGGLDAQFVQIIIDLLEEFSSSYPISADNKVLNLLCQRFTIVEQVGAYKREKRMDSKQPGRWGSVVISRKEWAEEEGFLKPDWMDRFLEEIHKYALSLEDKIILSPQGLTKVHGRIEHVLN